MDELLIVGGSAAGSAAGIYAARRNLAVRVIATDLGGEVARSGEIENFPSVIHTTGIELSMKFEEHLRSYPIPIETGVVVEQIEQKDGTFFVQATKDGQPVTYQAKTVIVTTGIHPRKLGVPGEDEYKNKGLSYCSVCDGRLFQNRDVVTIGGGNSALESAILLSRIARTVTILTINETMVGEAVLIEKLSKLPNVTLLTQAETTAITGEQFVTGVTYRTKDNPTDQHLPAQGVFVHIGAIPNSGCIHGVAKDAFGSIIVNEVMETNIPGLFAAGDVTNHPFKQIAIATGQGVTAALQAARYLDNQQV